SGTATFSVVDPSGQTIDFSSLQSPDGAHTINELGEFFSLNNPATGVWKLRILAGLSGADVSFVATENSLFGLNGYTVEQNITTGQNVNLVAQWSGNSNGIDSPTMAAQILNEAGDIVETVTLYDDCNHDDNLIGDGVFGGCTRAFTDNGQFLVIFTAQGSINGYNFARWAETSIDVQTPSHILMGSINDSAVDADADGVYETLRSTVNLTATGGGNYLVSADLQDAQGYYIYHAVGSLQTTTACIYSVNLDFKMTGTACSQYSAPFKIKNLRLTDANSLKVLDVYIVDITTQTYSGSLFGCTAGTPAPVVISVQPSSLFPSASGQVIINGTSFTENTQVSLGSGVTVSSVTYGSSTSLLAQVSFTAGAAAGLRDVTVTNQDGRSSTAPGLFAVASDQPPTVAISNLSDQQNLTGTVTVSASANDDLGI
ncbi:MAG: IPT/TIG domain-containing protein, partial [Leptolyngbyaceae cyanobacterium CAN_BIN12]|nr:IPT/TIG domain-containing protein [Leptolyngbyaceae cyanobacterium CAN_BIN12]